VHHIVDCARDAARSLEHTHSRRAFLAALAQFERMLSLAPDYPPGCVTGDDEAELIGLAEGVIAAIEDRLDRHTDRPSVQRTLGAAIYRLRRDVEEIDTVVRHGTAGNPSRNQLAARTV
jgi:hypothetical protein